MWYMKSSANAPNGLSASWIWMKSNKVPASQQWCTTEAPHTGGYEMSIVLSLKPQLQKSLTAFRF